MLGIPKGEGTWFQQQWYTLTHLRDADLPSLAFALGTLAVILGFQRFWPKVPGAIVAVLLAIILATVLKVSSHGVAVVGAIQGGFPPLGLPSGVGWSEVTKLLGVA